MGITKVAIIGGGISGLATLHFLKKRYKNNVQVTLYEANAFIGGNIRTFKHDGFLFETGPNGFLNNSPTTLELIDDLGLSESLIKANQLVRRRYIQIHGELSLVPSDVSSFIKSPLLNSQEKFRLIKGIFNKSVSKDQSIDGYVTKRFGRGVSQKSADPFMRGIFAGDIHQLHMKYAFPKMKKGNMTTLQGGMSQLIDAIEVKYGTSIQKNQRIEKLNALKADHIITTVPAFEAALLTGNKVLNDIRYCPLSVVGLGFDLAAFKNKPDGFGYLIPSDQGKDILGVLLESNVFAARAPLGMVMLRVMIGQIGDADVLVRKALTELDGTYGLEGKPKVSWVQSWPKAIPQYEMNYPDIIKSLAHEGNVKISGNFLNGIAFNDCINNAKDIANSMNL